MGEQADLIVDYMTGEGYHKTRFSPPILEKKCKYCGVNNLIWKPTEKGWRLASKSGDIHNCRR